MGLYSQYQNALSQSYSQAFAPKTVEKDMKDEEFRLKCLEQAGGNKSKAEEIYEFATQQEYRKRYASRLRYIRHAVDDLEKMIDGKFQPSVAETMFEAVRAVSPPEKRED